MKKKQIGWYLIFGGLAIFILKFITVILSFIGGNPILGLALIALIIFEYKTFIAIEIEILCRLKIESPYLLFHKKA